MTANVTSSSVRNLGVAAAESIVASIVVTLTGTSAFRSRILRVIVSASTARIGRLRSSHDVQRRGRAGMLFEWHVELWLCRPRRARGAHIRDDADNRHELEVVEAALDSTPDGILALKRHAGQRLVDDRHERRIAAIAVGEVAAAPDRHP